MASREDKEYDRPVYYKEFPEGSIVGFRFYFDDKIHYEAVRQGMVISFSHLGDALKWLSEPKCIAIAKHELCRIMLKHNHWIGHNE